MTSHQREPDPADADMTRDANPADEATGRAAALPENPAQAGLPQPPPGGRLLTTGEAIELIVTGGHPGSATGSLLLDVAIIDALRVGVMVACQLPDGRLAFTPVPPTT